ncbi:hypothetical protein TNCT_633341 [Trichonephila clavata]|uniref:Uncharacterized protein n=1 Tax=Trichonephila clavata TaxID=2740835 RepID=A0A8X6FK96_TRICU|nr:hypothetical protein TNCT_633341 [Trichonephila clavata]
MKAVQWQSVPSICPLTKDHPWNLIHRDSKEAECSQRSISNLQREIPRPEAVPIGVWTRSTQRLLIGGENEKQKWWRQVKVFACHSTKRPTSFSAAVHCSGHAIWD